MRIALLGYGKMGKVIEKIALDRGHTITHKINQRTPINTIDKEDTDIAIDFSSPEIAYTHIHYCIENNIPVVSGSTGWLDQLKEIHTLCTSNKGAFFYASNFSIGVNIFFKINEMLANMMNTQSTYQVEMEEIHHTEKLDAPSGTAITLAEQIIDKIGVKENWVNTHSDVTNELAILSKREDKVPGTHTVSYNSSVDSIEIKHTAHSREGFAMGAVLATEWLIDKEGIFGMNDLLKL